MAGYTRQDTANNIANGNVIDADDFDAEYNAIEDAFNASTGHKHDGTAGEGAPITKVGPSQDVVVSATNVNPKTTNTLDLGTSALQYKDGYFDGTVYQDGAVVGVNAYMTLSDNEIDVSSGDLTLDIAGNLIVDAEGDITLDVNGGDILLKDDDTTFGAVANSSGQVVIKSGTTPTTAITLSDADATLAGTLDVTGESTLASAIVSDLTSGRVVLAGTSGAIEDSGNLTFDGSTLAVTGAVTVSTDFTVNGNTTLGNAPTDTVTITADIASDVIPSADSTHALGDTSNYWSNAYIDAITTTGNVTIGGDLNVSGNTVVTGSTTNSSFLYELGTGTTGTPSNDSGIIIERGTSNNAFIGFDESEDKFIVGTGSFTSSSTGNLTITTGTLLANIEGDVTGDVTGDITGDVTGNLTGNVTGNVTASSGTSSFATVTASGNVTVTGDLTVNGTTTTVSTTNTVVSDSLIELGNGTSGTPANDAGIVIERGDSNNAFIGWDESADKFTLGTGTFTGASTGNLSVTTGTLVANLEGDVTGNADTATTAGTVTTAAQSNITSVGTLTTLTVDDITINGSTISDADALLLDVGTDLTLDVDGGDVFLKDGGTQRGSINVATANTVKHNVWNGTAYDEQVRLTTSGANVIKGLRVGDTTAPTDNDIYAAADIEAANNLTAGNEIVMTSGTVNWTFEVDSSNALIIQYGGTSLMKLDTSGNLTVAGNVTAFGSL